ncbi:MAG: beta-lactamase family protein [Acidimicrobiia bacterium]|nr:beta-lactamase family protein [Acidimicrobiia bacterium]
MRFLRFRVLFGWILSLTLASSLTARALPKARPEEVGFSAERLARLTSTFESYVSEGKLPGSVVLVARRGKIAYLQAFGRRDREANAPMPDNAIFRIASQTKALASVGVMMLQEQGKLLIADPVGKYLPEFEKTTVAVAQPGGGYDVVEAKRPITIRDLLTHTAGIGYGEGVARDRWQAAKIQGWYFADRDEPVGATVSRMAALPFDAQPGERFVYGYATDILGALVEKVSGQSLADFLDQSFFHPLAMEDTCFYLPPSKADRLAVVYSATKSGKLERAVDPGLGVGQGAYLKGPRKSFSAGAGILSTAMDYARFLQMMLNGGELEGKRLLSRKTVELMTVDHLVDKKISDGVGFGLGFSVVKDLGARGVPGSLGEFGWGGAYHSSYWVDPQKQLVVVYFTQLIPAGNVDDHGKLRALIYQALED